MSLPGAPTLAAGSPAMPGGMAAEAAPGGPEDGIGPGIMLLRLAMSPGSPEAAEPFAAVAGAGSSVGKGLFPSASNSAVAAAFFARLGSAVVAGVSASAVAGAAAAAISSVALAAAAGSGAWVATGAGASAGAASAGASVAATAGVGAAGAGAAGAGAGAGAEEAGSAAALESESGSGISLPPQPTMAKDRLASPSTDRQAFQRFMG